MSPQVLADIIGKSGVSPYEEMLAFEYLYSREKSSLKNITEMTVLSNLLPTQALSNQYGLLEPDGMDEVREYIENKLGGFSVAVNNTTAWPDKLRDAARPTPLFYYYGDLGLTELPSISIVGSRKASDNGIKRARRLAKELTRHDFVIVSGLAKGIDTAAMTSAITNGGKVVGVIGTPIDQYYPKENRDLQDLVASKYLLVSQVPFYKYANQPFNTRRWYFPERNELMAALSDATVIVEASDTSGTLTQARACLHQHRPLFILKSCFEDQALRWPKKYAKLDNVYIVDSTDQIVNTLKDLQHA